MLGNRARKYGKTTTTLLERMFEKDRSWIDLDSQYIMVRHLGFGHVGWCLTLLVNAQADEFIELDCNGKCISFECPDRRIDVARVEQIFKLQKGSVLFDNTSYRTDDNGLTRRIGEHVLRLTVTGEPAGVPSCPPVCSPIALLCLEGVHGWGLDCLGELTCGVGAVSQRATKCYFCTSWIASMPWALILPVTPCCSSRLDILTFSCSPLPLQRWLL